MAYSTSSLNPCENKNIGWLYCPKCGKKVAVYDRTDGEPHNTYPYCKVCRESVKPTKIQQRRVPESRH